MNDSGSIEVNSRRVPYYGSDSSAKKASSTTTSNTEGRQPFKKVLDEESSKGQEKDDGQTKVSSDDREAGDPVVLNERSLGAKPKKLVTPFDLSNARNKTSELPVGDLQNSPKALGEVEINSPQLVATADTKVPLLPKNNEFIAETEGNELQPKPALLGSNEAPKGPVPEGFAKAQPSQSGALAQNANGQSLLGDNSSSAAFKGAPQNELALNVKGEAGASQAQLASSVKAPLPLPLPQEQATAANASGVVKEVPPNPVGNEGEKGVDKPVDPFSFVSKESRVVKENPMAFRTTFTREPMDMASVSQNIIPQIAPVADISGGAVAQAPIPQPVVRANLQELINQMVSQITELTQNGKTETSLVLKHPPIFEGAKLTITAFDTANGEFNIAFENLKAPAQRLIDLQAHRSQLLDNLERLGYNVHIFTTSTTIENRPTLANADLRDKDRDQGQGENPDDQQRQRRQRQS